MIQEIIDTAYNHLLVHTCHDVLDVSWKHLFPVPLMQLDSALAYRLDAL